MVESERHAAHPPSGQLSRRVEDIARVLHTLHKRGQPVISFLDSTDVEFRSQLMFVDPAHQYILIAAPPPGYAHMLLSRSDVTFISDFNGWHIEFSASDPQLSSLGGTASIRMRFPRVVSTQNQRRTEPRNSVPGYVPLSCEADSAGFAPFDGELVDVSTGGIGFLTYASGITLEPGTILKGSRIQRPGKPPLVVDLEVRYSKPILLPDGRRGRRSGCVFLNPTRAVEELIASFNIGEAVAN